VVWLVGVCLRRGGQDRLRHLTTITGMCLLTNEVYVLVLTHILLNTGIDSEQLLDRILQFKDSEFFPQ
jgi:hypothetical protein